MKRLYVLLFLGLFAFAAGAILMTLTAEPAQACGWEDDCNDWEPEPDPDWDDCGCEDDSGDINIENEVNIDLELEVNVDVDVDNSNSNNVDNSVDNSNTNSNNNNVTNSNNNSNNNNTTTTTNTTTNTTTITNITNEGGGGVTANANSSAVANANATTAISAASQAAGRLSANNLRNSVFGRERRGAGGTIVNAARAPISIGPLRVVVKEERVSSRAVRGVCLDSKGLEEAAYLSASSTHVDVSAGSGELMYCQMGDALVATIGEVRDETGQVDYSMGQVIECLDGQSLRFGNGGRLACGASSNAYFTASSRSAQARYVEIFLERKSQGYAQEEASYRGATTFNGGVGY